MRTRIAVVLLLVFSLAGIASAENPGKAVFTTKCALCHGADLAGKPAAKIPSLIGDDAKKLSDADLTDMISNGGKDKKPMHAFASKGLPPDQIKMVVEYIRSAQKK